VFYGYIGEKVTFEDRVKPMGSDLNIEFGEMIAK
jgi:hypothetical protein